MKKALFILAVMLLCATTSFAEAKFSMTGSYWAEGKYWFNYNPGPGAKADYSKEAFGFIEQDINLFPKITIDNTSLNFKVAITDTWWGDYNENGSSDEKVTQDLDTGSIDDNIQIERAFLTHKFNDNYSIDVGLQDGTVFGTTFGDDKQPKWRIKGTAKTSAGILGAVLEKNKDRGSLAMGDESKSFDEGDDADAYGLFGITKVGDVYGKLLLWYVVTHDAAYDADLDLNGDGDVSDPGETTDLSSAIGKVDVKLFNPVLAFNGDLGPISFESEINYKYYTAEGGIADIDESFSTYGVYLNFWKALDNMTPGIILAYGSYNDEIADAMAELDPTDPAQAAPYMSLSTVKNYGAFDFEDDFDSSIILGDEYCWGGSGDDLQGMTLVKLYVNDIKTGIKPLTLFGYFNYVMSNQKDTDYEDATAWEACLGTNYAITSNLNYSVYGAFADISYDVDGIDDPDSVYMVANSISFSF